ncbi:MAG: hypothetical protein QM706_20790 [Nitrospira sp.]
MAGQQEDYSKLPITAIVSLTLGLIAWWLVSEPLVSTRQEGTRPISKSEQLIPARLWQDPLEALQVNDAKQGGEAKQPVRQFGFEHMTPARRTAVLVVMTEGAPYVENHEKRLRDRYAVVAALAAACFTPRDAEHIGSYGLPNRTKSSQLHKSFPFEWYEAQPLETCHEDERFIHHYDRVLVVWATDSLLGDQPIEILDALASSLNAEYSKGPCVTQRNPNCILKLAVKFIGPSDSPTLRTMLEAAENRSAALQKERTRDSSKTPQGIELYSPWATADPELLLRELGRATPACLDAASCEQALKDRLANAGIVLKHSVISDRELTLALALELQRRQVALGKDSIVLISEWDTFYGRALPIAFEKSIKSVTKATVLENIRRYSYLRGLDGLTPEDNNKHVQHDMKPAKTSSLQDATARAQNLQELERPDGQSQVDYLRRLAEKMRTDANHSGKPVKAIGILGSDIHDAKLILKALRGEFPNALFFTTTLDARLFEDSDLPWTRNMIIASPFGLALHINLQRDIPPFRDSYQTSAFFSVLRAVGHIQWASTTAPSTVHCKETGEIKYVSSNSYSVDDHGRTRASSARLCPRLFEIGRHGPVDLSVDRASLDAKVEELPLQPARALLPDGMKRWWPGADSREKLGITGTLISIGIAFCILLTVFTRLLGRGMNHFTEVAKVFKASTKLTVSLACAIVLYSVALLALLFFYARDAVLREGWEGEPISFLDGVSIWPSVVIRVVVICWCVGCLFLGWMHITLSHARLREEYHLDGTSAQSFREHLQNFIRSVGWVLSVQPPANSESINQIYQEYQCAGFLWCRLVRTVFLVLIYWMFLRIVLAIFSSGLSMTPCRGSFNCAFSETILYAAVMAMIFLNMFVFDAVLLCQKFVLRLKGVAAGVWLNDLKQRPEVDHESDPSHLSSALTVQLVASHTEALHRLMFCPFIALFLMIVSRNRYFDNWDFPIGIIIIWVVYAFIALSSIVRLTTAATQVRASAMGYLQKRIVAEKGRNQRNDHNVSQMRLLIDELQRVRKGAYAPFLWHPAFGTSLIAVISLLQYWVFGR